MAAVSSTRPQSKRKRENVLWELDMLESKLTNGSKKPRLVRTKLAIDRIQKKSKKAHHQPTANPNRDGKDTQTGTTEANTEELAKRALELKRKLVEQRIYYWIKELGRRLKRAKPLEIQRIVRKLKDARSSNKADTIFKLERELQVIKGLDSNRIAQAHLWKRLRRNRFLYASQLLPDSPPKVETVKSEKGDDTLTPEQAAIRQDVTARLFKTKSIQAFVVEAIDGVVTAVELAHNSLDRKKEKYNQPELQSDNEGEESRVEYGDEESQDSDDEQTSDRASGDKADVDEEGFDGEDGGSSSEIDISQYEGLVVDESDESEVDGDAGGQSIDYNEISNEEPEPEYDSSDPNQDSGPARSVAKTTMSETKISQKKGEIPKTTGKRAENIVLPSLSVGYISPSESDDDFDAKQRGQPASAIQRKNRRGQRARQKIWEQKYGKNATHVKKKEQDRKERDERKQNRRQERLARRQDTATANVPDLAAKEVNSEQKKAAENKPLHPSWEARQQKSGPVDFQGKKIVFA
ncbi:Bud-site selection protein [Lipomyces tetrasporus]|uniref:Bud-site selection protein n=1 Tax=Lipomyces tetrasporus TaxID=54092 RepID=A0AAD7VWE6_9ASCO|nr:Bud-site selection protein [Lipomyces tetrasporus]KAJ8104036.1 Bud-site selection protein [Lipomyces tetrasporus]